MSDAHTVKNTHTHIHMHMFIHGAITTEKSLQLIAEVPVDSMEG